MQETKDNLDAIIDKIAALNKELNEAKEEKDFLESEVKRCKRQVQAAEQLMDGL